MYNPLEILRDERVRDLAAAATVVAIRQEAEDAPAELRPVFLYTALHLFDADLSPPAMAARYGGEGGRFRPAFGAFTGMSPRSYLCDRRMRVCDRLVCETSISVKSLARVLGYETTSGLRRGYKKWSGRSIAARRAELAGTPPELPPPEPIEDMEIWRDVAAGAWVDVEDAAGDDRLRAAVSALIHMLVGRKPGTAAFFEAAPDVDPGAGEASGPLILYETWKAVRVHDATLAEPEFEQHGRVAYPIPFETNALHELLRCESEAAPSPALAFHLSDLAADSVQACAGAMSRAGLWTTDAWARARSARLAVETEELEAAERAVALGELALAKLAGGGPPGVEAGLLEAKALLRRRGQAFEGAGELASRAADLYRAAGDEGAAARCLVLELRCREGRDIPGGGAPAAAAGPLEEALRVAEEEGESALAARLSTELAVTYLRSGKLERAETFLERVKSLTQEERRP